MPDRIAEAKRFKVSPKSLGYGWGGPRPGYSHPGLLSVIVRDSVLNSYGTKYVRLYAWCVVDAQPAPSHPGLLRSQSVERILWFPIRKMAGP